MSRKILFHFRKVDPVLYQAMRQLKPLAEIEPRKPAEYFSALCSDIIGQQLSNKAAIPIEQRFIALFPRKRVSAKHLLNLSEEKIRGAGTSWAKVRSLKDLAEKTQSREIAFAKLLQMQDEEVIAELTKIKGIGRWTAEMFLIFTLARPDVFSHGDLGLRRAVERLYSLEDPEQKAVEAIAIRWSPFRSYASRALWHTLDGEQAP